MYFEYRFCRYSWNGRDRTEFRSLHLMVLPCRSHARQAVKRGRVACGDRPSNKIRYVRLPSGKVRRVSSYPWPSSSFWPLFSPRRESSFPHPRNIETALVLFFTPRTTKRNITFYPPTRIHYLIAKDFDLTITAMRGWRVSVSVWRGFLVRVYLNM